MTSYSIPTAQREQREAEGFIVYPKLAEERARAAMKRMLEKRYGCRVKSYPLTEEEVKARSPRALGLVTEDELERERQEGGALASMAHVGTVEDKN